MLDANDPTIAVETHRFWSSRRNTPSLQVTKNYNCSLNHNNFNYSQLDVYVKLQDTIANSLQRATSCSELQQLQSADYIIVNL